MSRLAAALLVGVLSWTSAVPAKPTEGAAPENMRATLRSFVGDYRGNWNTELTESDVDDISRYDLSDSVMRLSLQPDNSIVIRFFLNPAAAVDDKPLDLLGYGCRSGVGALRDLSQGQAADGTRVVHAVFDFDWGRCPSRVHAVPGTKLHVELIEDAEQDIYAARLTLLRRVQGDYQTYAKIDGQRRPVEVRRSKDRRGTLYHPELEYCLEDDLGETECFRESDRTTVGAAPGPIQPGVTVFWWKRKTPSLRVEKGRRLLYHEALYTRPRSSG